MDGSSIDMSKVDALVVGQVQKHDSEGKPMFEVADADGKAAPVMQMCVFARIGAETYPVRLIDSMHEAQVTIQSILGKLKSEYDKERGVIQVASAGEKAALKLS
jgi:DUF917 family protein